VSVLICYQAQINGGPYYGHCFAEGLSLTQPFLMGCLDAIHLDLHRKHPGVERDKIVFTSVTKMDQPQ